MSEEQEPVINEETLCGSVNFTCKKFNAGYIPFGKDVIKTGLLSISGSPDMPLASVSVTVTVECPEINFESSPGVYNTQTVTVTVNKGKVTYIPFKIKSQTCGEVSCDVEYEFTYETEEGSFTCTGVSNIWAYNATCDFQECLLRATEAVYCGAESICHGDLCSDENLQFLSKLVALDQVLELKIEIQDWTGVDLIYRTGLRMCKCNPAKSPCGEEDKDCQDCNQWYINGDCGDCGGGCRDCGDIIRDEQLHPFG